MKKIAFIAVAVLALSPVLAQASVTLNVDYGVVYKDNTTTNILPEGKTMVLLQDVDHDGFDSLIGTTTSWVAAGSDDKVVFRGASNWWSDTGWGSLADANDNAPNFTIIAADVGDPLLLVWYDVNYNSGAAGPGQNVHFGTFRTDDVRCSSDSGWFMPADGSLVGLKFLTLATGSPAAYFANTMGEANQMTSVVPEPATMLLLLAGGGLAAIRRRRAAK